MSLQVSCFTLVIIGYSLRSFKDRTRHFQRPLRGVVTGIYINPGFIYAPVY
jgi:hypothetical protein